MVESHKWLQNGMQHERTSLPAHRGCKKVMAQGQNVCLAGMKNKETKFKKFVFFSRCIIDKQQQQTLTCQHFFTKLLHII
jgi:hypothetical protein